MPPPISVSSATRLSKPAGRSAGRERCSAAASNPSPPDSNEAAEGSGAGCPPEGLISRRFSSPCYGGTEGSNPAPSSAESSANRPWSMPPAAQSPLRTVLRGRPGRPSAGSSPRATSRSLRRPAHAAVGARDARWRSGRITPECFHKRYRHPSWSSPLAGTGRTSGASRPDRQIDPEHERPGYMLDEEGAEHTPGCRLAAPDMRSSTIPVAIDRATHRSPPRPRSGTSIRRRPKW
jgi:hypothetical protein